MSTKRPRTAPETKGKRIHSECWATLSWDDLSNWAGVRSVTWDRKTVEGYDAVIIATNHQVINYQELADWSPCIVDARNAMSGIKTKPEQVWKA